MLVRSSSVIALFALSALMLAACGNSPLANHRNAAVKYALQAPTKDCPLSFPQAGLCASVEWAQLPAEGQTGSLRLRFWNAVGGNAAGPYVTPPHTVAVKLWMPSMGHGSSPVTVTLESNGVSYLASGVYFVMPGAWEIWVQLKDGNQVIEQAKIDCQA